jgi:hypothetical protein
MKQYNRFSARASLAAVGIYLRRRQVWEPVKERVQIQQKQVKHAPLDKLLDVLINILSGGQGIVEVNTRVRPDRALQRAFGRQACADQSTISQTLNACDEQTVAQLRLALQVIYCGHSRGYRHAYEAHYQVLDIDLTGLVAGRQAEQATKGFFSGQRNRRGRQLGRVLATRYDEIVFEKLYPGTVQLEQNLQELLQGAEAVLELNRERRRRTIVRGMGRRADADVNWLLERGTSCWSRSRTGSERRNWHNRSPTGIPIPKFPIVKSAGWKPHTLMTTLLANWPCAGQRRMDNGITACWSST